ncbi:MAG: lysine--tRNA ligase [Hyphomicrobiales bacterium]|nr:lysine--tRNA ligase [Hyphomicrobiales bacterium]
MNPLDTELALSSRAWPFEEAGRLLKRLNGKTPEKGYVLFETGYGPSGLPHIGTFGEVFRTTLVRRAFQRLCNIPTRLFAFSDDMDGLRKVPDNIPNADMVSAHLGKPLTAIPDPFGTHESFGAHMNHRLQQFLDRFGFEYSFKSATECYKSGLFDTTLLRVLAQYEAIQKIMLPTLGEERRATYSPFMPICPKTGKVLQAPVTTTNAEKGTITYTDEDGESVETPVTGGRCKLQWKPDWGMRWAALNVDYEMHGKDLIPSAQLSAKICRVLGGTPPELFVYELFLDEHGQKISKSKGNGITLDEWLRYATPESLALYMYQSPKKAKRLHFDVIPKHVDEYLSHLQNIDAQEEAKKLANPVWHIHDGSPPAQDIPISFNLLLNLTSACNPEDKSVLWGFITRYAPDATPEKLPELDMLVGYAMAYYEDFIKPTKLYRLPTAAEKDALKALATALEGLEISATAETIQNTIYEIGKSHGFENLRDWFKALYEILLGQEQGPRMGSFIALYGVNETLQLIRRVLRGESLAA